MGRFINESMRTGLLVATGGLLPSSKGGLIVRSAAGRITVTDGPFAEAKEFVGGFALLEVKSRDEVIECTKQFLSDRRRRRDRAPSNHGALKERRPCDS